MLKHKMADLSRHVFGLFGEYYITNVIGKNEHCLTSFLSFRTERNSNKALYSKNSTFKWAKTQDLDSVSVHGNGVIQQLYSLFYPRESYPKEALKMALRHQWYQSGFQWNEIAQLGEDKRLSCEERRVYCRYVTEVNITLALSVSCSHFSQQFCQVIDTATLH